MQNRSKETRTRILNTALDLFSHSGYEATGVAEICKAAGVSKGAFYYHFPTKQAVFLELLEIWMGELDAQMANAQAESQNVPQALTEMAAQMGMVLQVASSYLPMFLEFWAQALRDPEVWEAVISPYRRYRRYFENLIQRGISEGSLHQIEPGIASSALVSVAVGLLLQSVLVPEDADWGSITHHSIELFLNGLAKKGHDETSSIA